jgi:hypothetical protein
VVLPSGTGNFVLNEQDTASWGTVSGFGQVSCVSNFWYSMPNCQAIWIRLQGGTGKALWITVVQVTQRVKEKRVLTMDYNELAGNVAGEGCRVAGGRFPRMPGGYLAQALKEMEGVCASLSL